jgi:hypothetical protein
MLNVENLHAALAGKPIIAGLLAASALSGCSADPGAGSGPKPRLRCSVAREELRKDRELLARRVEKMRASRDAAAPGRPGGDREFQELMADIERSEGRFAARSKECVEE